jgi:eukaryotic-like serine/threonine-protein kinase
MARATLGRYEVLARIASGGAANVFLAKSRGAAGFHKMVCLKALRPELAGDPGFTAMFLDEARLAARLRHPNCVEIYDLGHAAGIYFLSMEYLLGESLRTLMQLSVREKPLFRAQHLAFIVAAACDGLHHAHELCDAKGESYGLVHRDVSPRNIMVTADGYTKVIDFGIAKTTANLALTAAGSVKGKPSYMSPEQITGHKVDRRSDVFSLGVVLFEALSNRRLFVGDSLDQIARMILGGKIPRLRDVDPKAPRELDLICAKALARDPEKRFSTSREMAVALREFLERAWPAQGTTELARTLEEYLGAELKARQHACDMLLIEDDKDAEHLRVLNAEPVTQEELLPLSLSNTSPPELDEDSLAQTQVEEPDDPVPPTIPPRAVSAATIATQIDTVREVPPLEISVTDADIKNDRTKSIPEITHPELDDEDEEKLGRPATTLLVVGLLVGAVVLIYAFVKLL